MRNKSILIAVVMVSSTLAGCTSDNSEGDLSARYQEGYDAGYADAYDASYDGVAQHHYNEGWDDGWEIANSDSQAEIMELQAEIREMHVMASSLNQTIQTLLHELSEDGEVEIDGCNYPTERGVVLSFDDRTNIQSWNESREFFDSRGVKATFFVDNWNTIEAWELEILRNLSSDGHEIGFHSTSHGGYYDFIEQNLTADDYFESEIIAGLELMESYGFFPTSFAYPRGHRDTEIDELILNEFSVLRGTRSNVNGSESWMAECKDLSVFRSFSLTDEETKWIPHSFNESEESNISILLNGHGIGGGGYPISYDELEYLINEIERFDLSFLLMSELSK